MAAPALFVAMAAHAQPAINAETLAPFFDAAAVSRVDIVGIGDSNQIYGGHGWDHGFQRALTLRFGMYATGLLSAGEGLPPGNGSASGYGYQIFSSIGSGQFLYSGAPVFYDAMLSPDVGISPLAYDYVPQGSSATTTFNLGFFIEPTCALNVNANLRFTSVYGVFVGPAASFNPMVRLQEPPYSTLVTAPTVSSSGDAPGVATTSLQLPAATRNMFLNYRIATWGPPLVGPFIWYYMRAENLDRTRGISFHTLYGFGGRSSRDMAAALQAADDSYLTLFFSQVRSRQSGPRHVLVRVNTGLNDRAEMEPSVGPNPQSHGNTSAAFADNLQGIINRVGAIWTLNGWDPTELYFLITPSHPIADPDDEQLVGYREAAAQVALANPRTACVRLDMLTTSGEMLANNWYQSFGFDRNHLTQPAFEELSRRELFALRSHACWADFNADGFVGFSDLNVVLSFFGQTAFGASAPLLASGDIDGDGDVDFADLNLVLSEFGGPCDAH